MLLIGFLVVWIASFIPLFTIPPQTGGWLLAGLVCCALSAYLGWGMVGMSALSDHTTNLRYYGWWVVSVIIAAWGTLGFIYCLMSLLWRGSGIAIHVDVHS